MILLVPMQFAYTFGSSWEWIHPLSFLCSLPTSLTTKEESVIGKDKKMMRRVCSNTVRRNGGSMAKLVESKAVVQPSLVESRRHLEPMSVWYLASWTCVWWYSFFFWLPVLWADMIVPSFVYNKLPVIHFIQEKRAEQKLRRVLDETYTQWSTELEASHITDAIARTF
ncbi:hypothetical protein, conserved [Leishmania donovani]|uniref:Uncharacterized protein n=3 Tax=Leishmania donovani TaxID=5661 RepID=E9BQP8_LEIDO|nr:hypothetical protein, conserved [Leishmania donovani]AYU82433.1 hypothetical protein LdCL_340015100 [Leishmania donovani]CBZ37577.1 hypothetical protein, conserved [Leishmania donovani]